jgi:hypothetical protein
MKKILTFIVLTICLNNAKAQVKPYSTASGELIFSFADYKINNEKINTPVRFTCFFHLGVFEHFDFSEHVGLYTGGAIRNVGFTSNESADTMVKRRNYYIGVPLALKLGNLKEDTYFFGGAEGEFAINYKEKVFINENKIDALKFNTWFSDRTNAFMPSVFAGFNHKSGLNVKFKYYLRDFYNKDYTAKGVKIYENTTSQMFYFSLSMNLRTITATGKTYNKGL